MGEIEINDGGRIPHSRIREILVVAVRAGESRGRRHWKGKEGEIAGEIWEIWEKLMEKSQKGNSFYDKE